SRSQTNSQAAFFMNHSDQTTPARSTLGKALPEQATLADMPQRIGRYRVQRILGQGSFGIVYLADDEQLQRRVAIRVPHRALVRRPGEAEPYLGETRVRARLDHRPIVPV